MCIKHEDMGLLDVKLHCLHCQTFAKSFHSKFRGRVDVIEQKPCVETEIKKPFINRLVSVFCNFTDTKRNAPCIPMTLLITTIWPLCRRFMSGSTSFTSRASPKKFVSKSSFMAATLWHSSGPIMPTPALFTIKARYLTLLYCRLV